MPFDLFVFLYKTDKDRFSSHQEKNALWFICIDEIGARHAHLTRKKTKQNKNKKKQTNKQTKTKQNKKQTTNKQKTNKQTSKQNKNKKKTKSKRKKKPDNTKIVLYVWPYAL